MHKRKQAVSKGKGFDPPCAMSGRRKQSLEGPVSTMQDIIHP